MNEAELHQLLVRLEDQTLEFGRIESLSNFENDFAPKIIAFANTRGGHLIVGIDDRMRNIVGLGIPAQKAEEVIGRLCAKCDPSPEVACEVVSTADGKTVLLVAVRELPKSQKPCILKRSPGERWLCYIRRGSQVCHATPEELAQMWQASGRLRFEAMPVWEVLDADLDESKMLAYLTSRSPIGLVAERLTITEKIRAIGSQFFYGDQSEKRSTIACVLLFARHPQGLLPQAKINAMQFPGRTMEPAFLLRKVLGGTVDDLIDAADAFIRQALATPATIPPLGTTREDHKPLPDYVIREAIANAVMHRDYSLDGEEIQVRVFSDRLEVESPGGLPGDLTLEDLESPTSLTRNPILSDALRECRKVERAGFGIHHMRSAMADHGCKPPEFRSERTFRVTLYTKPIPQRELRLYRSTFTLQSNSASHWRADTLFGHMCWFLLRHLGAERLREFLMAYEDERPPILLSDGFPSDFLPRPLLPLTGPPTQMSKAERIEHQRAAKQAAQTDWLTLDEFNRARRGESFSPSLSEEAVASVMGLNVTPKNQVDRLTDTAGGEAGELYEMPEFVIPRVTIYWRIEDGYLDLVRAFLDDLKETGYGKRKSIGYGQIEKATLEEFNDFTDTPDANGFVSLSRFVPSPRDPADGYWSLAVKYGKLGEEFAVSGNPFKRPLVQLTCGACFRDEVKPDWIRRWYGQLIGGLSKERPEAKQYAFAFLLPMRLPNRE